MYPTHFPLFDHHHNIYENYKFYFAIYLCMVFTQCEPYNRMKVNEFHVLNYSYAEVPYTNLPETCERIVQV
jgi:hypothetical protein